MNDHHVFQALLCFLALGGKNRRNVFSQNLASVPSLGLHSVSNGAHLEPL